jgi:hypothetical protein
MSPLPPKADVSEKSVFETWLFGARRRLDVQNELDS